MDKIHIIKLTESEKDRMIGVADMVIDYIESRTNSVEEAAFLLKVLILHNLLGFLF